MRYPDSTKTSLQQRLSAQSHQQWSQLQRVIVRHRAQFSYIDGLLLDDDTIKLARLRYIGSAHDWRFAIYRASHNDYAESLYLTDLPYGTCEDALDLACNLYLQ